MTNYYELLGVKQSSSAQEIKKAFRERAKKLHPDISGGAGDEEMRKLLVAYKTLLDANRRFEYDRVYKRFTAKYNREHGSKQGFDYRSFLKERKGDPSSQAKLIFFELLHLEEEAAIKIWLELGGLEFRMEKYLDREDWMDCTFLLAEELDRRKYAYEAFILLVKLMREEKRLPYFRHFMPEVEKFLKELVRLHLRSAVDLETFLECMEVLLGLDFPAKDKERWMRAVRKTKAVL